MKAKRKRKMTAEGRRRISIAMKKRWAAHRKAASNRNPYLAMTVSEFVQARRQLMDAWAVARKMLR